MNERLGTLESNHWDISQQFRLKHLHKIYWLQRL